MHHALTSDNNCHFDVFFFFFQILYRIESSPHNTTFVTTSIIRDCGVRRAPPMTTKRMILKRERLSGSSILWPVTTRSSTMFVDMRIAWRESITRFSSLHWSQYCNLPLSLLLIIQRMRMKHVSFSLLRNIAIRTEHTMAHSYTIHTRLLYAIRDIEK